MNPERITNYMQQIMGTESKNIKMFIGILNAITIDVHDADNLSY